MDVNSTSPMKNRRVKDLRYTLCSILLILSPWILLFLCILRCHEPLANSMPFSSDEMGYWHQVLSLCEKGLDFGYYGFDEISPQYLSFGSHGFGTISAYLPYSKIFGWNYNSIVLANNFYMSIAFFLLVVIARPSVKKMLLIALCYLTFMPLILYNFTSMSELLNHAVLIIYFTLLYTYIKAKRYKNFLFAILLIFTAYISFIRVINIVLFLPVLLEKFKVSGFNRNFWKASTIWIVLAGAVYYLNSLFVAPFPYSFMAELHAYSSVPEKLYELQKHFFKSIGRFFGMNYDSILQILERYFIFIILGIFLWKSEIIQSKFKKWNFPFFISFFILFTVLIITFAAYDVFDWRDYRAVAPIFFGLIVFITLTEEKTRLIKFVIGINFIILAILVFVAPSSFRRGVFTKERYEQVIPNYDLRSIEYDPNAKSKFDNTIIVDDFVANVHLNIPGGIGITACLGGITDNLKSRYIYSPKKYDLKTYEIIRSSPKGFLYRKIEK